MDPTTLNDTLGQLALEMWTDNQVAEVLIEEDCFLGLVKKDYEVCGDPLVEGIVFSGNGGTGSTLGDAQATYNSRGDAKWQYALYDEHAIFRITNKAKLSMKTKSAMVDGLEHVMEKAVGRFKRNMALNWWRNHGGSRGVIRSVNGTTLTLEDPDDAIHIEIGDHIVSADNDGTALGATDDGEAVLVEGVNPELGTITKAGAAWDAAGNFQPGDNIFARGTIGLKLQGVPDWLPSVDPVAGVTYNNIDRSIAPVHLAGVRFEASASRDGTMTKAIKRSCAQVQRYGGRVTDYFVDPLSWDQCASEMGDPTIVIVNAKSPGGGKIAHIGYEALVIHTVRGPLRLHSCVHIPRGRGYGLDMKTWKAVGNRVPGLDKHDGKSVLRMGDQAALEGRYEAYCNVVCNAPGRNVTADLTPVLLNDEEEAA